LISLPTSSGDAESAIANLDVNYAEIFSSLQITVFHPAEMVKGERQQSLAEVAAGGAPAMYMALIFVKMSAIGTLSHLLLSRGATVRCLGQDL
jgi:hypothetical protein